MRARERRDGKGPNPEAQQPCARDNIVKSRSRRLSLSLYLIFQERFRKKSVDLGGRRGRIIYIYIYIVVVCQSRRAHFSSPYFLRDSSAFSSPRPRESFICSRDTVGLSLVSLSLSCSCNLFLELCAARFYIKWTDVLAYISAVHSE